MVLKTVELSLQGKSWLSVRACDVGGLGREKKIECWGVEDKKVGVLDIGEIMFFSWENSEYIFFSNESRVHS